MERFLTSRVLMCETSRSETFYEIGDLEVHGLRVMAFAPQIKRNFLQSKSCVPLLLVPSNKSARPVKAYLAAEKNVCYGNVSSTLLMSS